MNCPRKAFTAALYSCDYPGCRKALKTPRGLHLHYQAVHVVPRDLRFPPPPSTSPRDDSPVQDILPPPTDHQPHPPEEPEHSEEITPPPPSPTFSSRRSPRRTPSGSPLQVRRSPRPVISVSANQEEVQCHPLLDGTPCDVHGNDLEKDAPPPQAEPHDPTDYSPFPDRGTFEFSEFLYTKEEMSAGNVDQLLDILSILYKNDPPPFKDHDHMYSFIDSIKQGDIPWESFSVTYQGDVPEAGPVPSWMQEKYEVWFRDPLQVMENQIGNVDFDGHFDYAPKRIFFKGKRRYRDLMTGNWAWEQADEIAIDESTHGAMFAPVVLGSDKTTVSVATGQNEYYPLYGSIGGVHNSVRRAHRNAVALLGFLAIPKTSREHKDCAEFRKFRRQLFHSSLQHILSSLHPFMTKPRVTRCADGHYRRVIYGLGPYIADYPEQALLACIVQNWCAKCTAPPDDLDSGGIHRSHEHTAMLLETFTLKDLWESYGIVGDLVPFTDTFPRADIHALLAPDLLHQIIKGTFKDHLVDWVEAYIKLTYKDTPRRAAEVLADIDRRIAAAPAFPGLRRFPQGRGFKQWTGNDSKGLMKVYLAAIHGHVPAWMTRAVAAVIDFCYLVRRSTIDEDTLIAIQDALSRFHHYREVFRNAGVREDFSLPRQHALTHYPFLITQFGAPNGLCSSITESKHIKAVKRPYRRSSRNKPLGQMLVTNQRNDKLAAARIYFKSRNMLGGPGSPIIAALRQLDLTRSPESTLRPEQTQRETANEDQDVGAVDGPESMSEVTLAKTYVRKVPSDIHSLSHYLKQPRLPELAARFLYSQLNPDAAVPASDFASHELPAITGKVRIFNSARAVFYAPSDLSGVGGMRHERIRAMRSWYGGAPRYDCVFVGKSEEPGFRGLHIARVFLFFSFSHDGVTYPCALVHWFSPAQDSPCPDTGMWMVEPDFRLVRGRPHRVLEVIHLDSIMRGAHLLGVSGKHFLPSDDFDYTVSLDQFHTFFVNKFADHHAHEVAF